MHRAVTGQLSSHVLPSAQALVLQADTPLHESEPNKLVSLTIELYIEMVLRT